MLNFSFFFFRRSPDLYLFLQTISCGWVLFSFVLCGFYSFSYFEIDYNVKYSFLTYERGISRRCPVPTR